MNEQEKNEYLKNYEQSKKKGVPFFPNILFKDAVISLVIFLVLVALAYFIGAPLEERANPADTSYTPRPEWYFLFLFQLLKYFPGHLEVIGVVVLPTLAILALFVLPLIDKSSLRHFSARPFVVGFTAFLGIGIIVLTFLSIKEAPPPIEATTGDQTAALYTKNCAPCHGATIKIDPGTNLHAIIAEGKHEGMPAWSADLTSDQIDALAGFILSPGGSQLFTDNCSACHEIGEVVAANPIELKKSLEQGQDYKPHEAAEVPHWTELLGKEEITALLNFLAAPDGQRLFATNCSPCHGSAVAITVDEEALRTLISHGGLHLEMPPWQGKLNTTELDTLAKYVVDPAAVPEGEELFSQNCSSCHGERIPKADNTEQAQEIISSGGSHQTMPVWGDVLTSEQLDALVQYSLAAAEGAPTHLGQELYAQNCASCHGEFGEGGPNPARAGDTIAPISTAEFLNTRDDFTLRAIIAQGQPNFGMSPFGSSYGGPLDDEQVDAVVAFMRAWQANPPVELPPDAPSAPVSLSGEKIFQELCAQCHGESGAGGIGPSLKSEEFQEFNSNQGIYDTINLGHKATAMIGWGDILSADQILELVAYIRQLGDGGSTSAKPPSSSPTFLADVLPIFTAKCNMCHGTMGGWDGTTYQTAINSGDNGPAVIPGNPEGSLLIQKLLGTQTIGGIMPPGGKLSDAEIQLILNWIASGAAEK